MKTKYATQVSTRIRVNREVFYAFELELAEAKLLGRPIERSRALDDALRLWIKNHRKEKGAKHGTGAVRGGLRGGRDHRD